MKHLALLFAVPSALALSSLFAAEPKSLPTKIVVFISDDHGMLDAGPFGATDICTPHRSRLATLSLDIIGSVGPKKK